MLKEIYKLETRHEVLTFFPKGNKKEINRKDMQG